jgi:hypothetical protein
MYKSCCLLSVGLFVPNLKAFAEQHNCPTPLPSAFQPETTPSSAKKKQCRVSVIMPRIVINTYDKCLSRQFVGAFRAHKPPAIVTRLCPSTKTDERPLGRLRREWKANPLKPKLV